MRTLFCSLLVLVLLTTRIENTHAQQLTLDQLITLSGRDVDQINEYLASRGWAFDDAAQEEDEEVAHASWAFQKTSSYYDSDNARAQAWLQINNPGSEQHLIYQTSSKAHYDAVRTRILAFKMERLGSDVVKGGIRTSYAGANFIVTTSVRAADDGRKPVYLVLVQRKDAYLRRLLNSQDSSESEPEETSETEESELAPTNET